MHPSRVIHARRSRLLVGRRIVLGVSGSIAAIESPRIARELIRHGAEVHAVLSAEATRIVSEEALVFATGHPTVARLTGGVEHVTLLGPGEGRADLLLIAPATANTISKIAHGIDDTPVTSCASVALGGGVPILLAPAMHAHMGQNPAVRENLTKLQSWGVGIVAPEPSEGEEKIASPEEIAAATLHRLATGPWAGRRVLVVGGASRESIDEVRSVTNESSGETAVQLAVHAYHRGAEVELWAGALRVPVPRFVPTQSWRGVADLHVLIERSAGALGRTDVALVPAALSDFTLDRRPGKIPSRGTDSLRLELRRAPKVLPELRRRLPPPRRLIGFKLAAGQSPSALEGEARRLLADNGLDFVVANDVASVGGDRTKVAVVRTGASAATWLSGTKSEVAGALLELIGPDLVRDEPPGRPATPGRTPGERSHRTPARRRPSRRRA
ncbi:MAG TPA: bifunctional phosphopantothenoylcysteine decarboxylase/phosphopantothenate--cysteine ligase CoaBC [Thermoplasmata archaeon]|nr:bifunctional phosphopantothenoylcysteine decarboxylase/phosphopantothenate--cysteine ligase CoaBC [Thermoplasmata archaeon]